MTTNGEAHSVNTLLRYLLNIPVPGENRGPYDEAVLEAAVHLATRARKALHGYGVSPDDVRAAWDNRCRPVVPVLTADDDLNKDGPPCPSGRRHGPMIMIGKMWYCQQCTEQVDPTDVS